LVTGQTARRKFLKQSGRAAVAAPAAVLLLSAASKSAANNIVASGEQITRVPTAP
jgi:anaerobic selenocysteine-containing dehydrogenase